MNYWKQIVYNCLYNDNKIYITFDGEYIKDINILNNILL